jgi:hypothetical protein
MTNHLSSEQISRLLGGDGTSAEGQHAGSCAECERELSRVQETLLAFSHSVRHWAEAHTSTCVPDSEFLRNRPSIRRMGPLRWALAAAAVIILIVVPLYKNAGHRYREADSSEDAVLLEQVNAHLSRTVASPIEPFMQLLSDTSAGKVGGRQ